MGIFTSRCAGILALLVVMAVWIVLPADAGTVTGHARIEAVKGNPSMGYQELYEHNIFLNGNGSLIAGQHYRAGVGAGDGSYSFLAAGGTYSIFSFQPLFFPRPQVTRNIVIPTSGTVVAHTTHSVDYSCTWANSIAEWGSEPWETANVFFQTFIATGSAIVGANTKLAGVGSLQRLRFTIHQDNGGSITSWPQVGPTRTREAATLTDLWVRYRHGEVPTVPGVRYALRLSDDVSTSNFFTILRRLEDGNGYTSGQAYTGSTSQNYDLYGQVFADNDGTISTMNKTTVGVGKLIEAFPDNAGQTFKAKGDGLAAVGLFIAGETPPYDPSWRITATLSVHQGGPGGAQVGPSKTSTSGFQGPGTGLIGWSFNEGEVPLTNGSTYYIKVTPTNGFSPYFMDNVQDIFSDGAAFENGVALPSEDLNMTIMEYEGGVPPTSTPTPTGGTPTPKPTTGPELIANGSFEDGADNTHAGWTRVSPVHGDVWVRNLGFAPDGLRVGRFVGVNLENPFSESLVQQVTGLTPGLEYQLSGSFLSNLAPSELGVYWLMLGFDLTGQTTNPAAASVQYLHTVQQSGTWTPRFINGIIPTGTSMSIWIWGGVSFKGLQFTDFDKISLQRVTGSQPPTSTPTPTITPTPAPDFDGDGIPDANEGGKAPAAGKTNLYLPDSDGDGLGDGVEDTNKDGIRQPATETNARARDTDGDQYIDGYEQLIGLTNPLSNADPAQALVDADSDELPASSDPNDSDFDTDNDRYKDGYEAVKIFLGAESNASLRPDLGDVDNNNSRDNADSQLILNFFGGLATNPSFTPLRTDVDRNGVIDNADAQQALNYFGSIVPGYPAN